MEIGFVEKKPAWTHLAGTERMVRGFYWPEEDIANSLNLWTELDTLDVLYHYCKAFRLVIQAGGNVGVWPKKMSEKFGIVYTFEPDYENFRCLVRNCPEGKIVKIQAALGEVHGMTGMTGRRTNCGEYMIEGKGFVPVLRIDDFKWPFVDLISLDLEGFEPFALRGAFETIDKFRPVICCENKGKAWAYGFEEDDIDRMLESFSYERVATSHQDKIYVAKEIPPCK